MRPHSEQRRRHKKLTGEKESGGAVCLHPFQRGTLSPERQSCTFSVQTQLLIFNSENPFATWNPMFDCCTWHGVECNQTTNYVTSLDIALPYVDLNGTIPPSLGELQHLTYLRLHKIQNLVGEIPSEIGYLTNLRSLTISWTNISGPIPGFLANLKSLVFLDLSFNSLSGSIPPVLATLPYLRGFDFRRNQLTGPTPESFGHMPATAENPILDLSHNQLSGVLAALECQL